MQWQVGVTSVPPRLNNLLPTTLASLRSAGFANPRLFVDGATPLQHIDIIERFDLPVTVRHPLVRVAANWFMSMQELYLRNPTADRYCIFQDDILAVKNLKKYLDSCFPEPDSMKQTYLNCYQVLGNRALAMQQPKDGWFKSNQLGKGALCLIFDNEGVRTLLASPHMINRVYEDASMGWRSVDGGISEALCRKASHTPHECNLAPEGHTENCKRGRYVEMCHRPGLVQHIGEVSAVDKRKSATVHEEGHPEYRWDVTAIGEDWPGEEFDPMEDPGLTSRMPCRRSTSSSEEQPSKPSPVTLDEWEREREAILKAIAGDEERLKKEPGKRAYYGRVITDYKTRLREWELRKPKG